MVVFMDIYPIAMKCKQFFILLNFLTKTMPRICFGITKLEKGTQISFVTTNYCMKCPL